MTATTGGTWADHAHRELGRAGHRAGGARAEVVRVLAGQGCCISAQEIFDRLRAGDRTVGLASVYRALEALLALGLVHRLQVDGTAAYERADPGGEHHHHVICDSCGEIAPFEDHDLEQAIDHVAGRLGYEVQAHDIVLRGACPDCARA